jgi:lipopolysaccharide export LptBFGC system permease protein LptF
MSLSALIQPVSIAIEVLVVLAAILIAVRKGRPYGWLIALTFAIYVIYDSARFTGAALSGDLLAVLFLIASVSALGAVWMMYRAA